MNKLTHAHTDVRMHVRMFVDNLCRAQVAALFTVVPAAAASACAGFVCYSCVSSLIRKLRFPVSFIVAFV